MAQWWEKEVGPLPLGLWVLVVGGGMGLAVLVHRSQQNDEPELIPADMVTPTGPVGMPQGAAPPAGPTLPANNSEWLQRAISALIGNGFAPYTVDQALSRYLEAQQLTAGDQGIVDAAIRAVGPPPDPPGTAPPPALPRPPGGKPKPKPKPPAAPKFPEPKWQLPGERTAHGPIKVDDGKGAYWLSNKGGLWTAGTAIYRGTYLGLRPENRQGAQETFGRLQVHKNGHYTEVSTTGNRFEFGRHGRITT